MSAAIREMGSSSGASMLGQFALGFDPPLKPSQSPPPPPPTWILGGKVGSLNSVTSRLNCQLPWWPWWSWWQCGWGQPDGIGSQWPEGVHPYVWSMHSSSNTSSVLKGPHKKDKNVKVGSIWQTWEMFANIVNKLFQALTFSNKGKVK